MRNLIRRLKCWYYRDELVSLEALVFVSRLDPETASVSTKDWREWAETLGIDENEFEQTRYWLEQQGFVAYWGGRYSVSTKGVEWHESLTSRWFDEN